MALINCGSAYEQEIPGCIPEIVFTFAELTEETDYNIVLGFPNSFKVKTTITTDRDKSFTLTKNDLLEGFWTNETGPVTLQIYDGNKCLTESVVICGTTFSQIVLNFKPIETNDATISVPCTCTE